jgi:toxin ParE1/3/4
VSRSPLVWLPEALHDLDRLLLFLAEANPEAAGRAAKAIVRGADLLAESGLVGRPLADGTGRREWPVIFAGGAYILRYRLDDAGKVVVMRVWHSREDRG